MNYFGIFCGFLFAVGCALLTFSSGVGHLGVLIALCGSICTFIINFKITYQDVPKFFELLFGKSKWFSSLSIPRKAILVIGMVMVLMMAIAYSILVYAGAAAVLSSPPLALLFAFGTFIAVLAMDICAMVDLVKVRDLFTKVKNFLIRIFTHQDTKENQFIKVVASVLTVAIIIGGLALSAIGLWYASYAPYMATLESFSITSAFNKTLAFIGILIMPLIAQIPFMLQTTMATLQPSKTETIGLMITKLLRDGLLGVKNEMLATSQRSFMTMPLFLVLGVIKLSLSLLAFIAGGQGGVNVMGQAINKYFVETSVSVSGAGQFALGIVAMLSLIVVQVVARLIVYLPLLIVTAARGYNALSNGEVARFRAPAMQKTLALLTGAWLSFCFAANGDAQTTLKSTPAILTKVLDRKPDTEVQGYAPVKALPQSQLPPTKGVGMFDNTHADANGLQQLQKVELTRSQLADDLAQDALLLRVP